MNKKIKVAVIFGGRSAEHEVSLQSAKNVIDALNKNKYETILIGIDKSGRWFLNESSHFLLNENNPKLIALNKTSKEVTLAQGKTDHQLVAVSSPGTPQSIDVVFPVLHGPYGEDGTIQGFLKLANLPYVGPDVLGSAIGMDKDVQKRLLKEAKIPTAKFLILKQNQKINFKNIKKEFGMPLFVKPANLGSSVGVSKVRNESEFIEAVSDAFKYDNKILIEEFIKGKEIITSVLGNENPLVSIPGEIIPTHEFYSYEAKYIDEKGAYKEIPAKIPKKLAKKIRDLSIQAFQVLCCEGMARVDFFLKENGQVLVNEINTIPGFTKISMYPKLWQASGISYSELIDRLIKLALERHKRDQKLKTNVELKNF